jgi:hypothetical protein
MWSSFIQGDESVVFVLETCAGGGRQKGKEDINHESFWEKAVLSCRWSTYFFYWDSCLPNSCLQYWAPSLTLTPHHHSLQKYLFNISNAVKHRLSNGYDMSPWISHRLRKFRASHANHVFSLNGPCHVLSWQWWVPSATLSSGQTAGRCPCLSPVPSSTELSSPGESIFFYSHPNSSFLHPSPKLV